ncbi:unnamed protein product [Vitrella brassicaformis CCMP3155]|uniref:Uncharacterized protein n=1 Tax=Vitrella brassicaformis (strain CCMP3155) TaxID=1169540 RepID=A0A0G4EEV6_VITBC|nr:unnamed protein product [Vitrella brassicaformis CCMP3155]|eukprot:CEL93909.1 unnamed protein product [Vitrella brassicaformis CCMP3155]
MSSLIEAVFCFNSGPGAIHHLPPSGLDEALPPTSTKEQRYNALKCRQSEQEDAHDAHLAVPPERKKAVTEVVVEGVSSLSEGGQPKFVVNDGEPVQLLNETLAKAIDTVTQDQKEQQMAA